MYRRNADNQVRTAERIYASNPTLENLKNLNEVRVRHGVMPELPVEHLQWLAESVAVLIDAEEYEAKDDSRRWVGHYRYIEVSIDAHRLYDPKEQFINCYLQVGRNLAAWETRKNPQIEIYPDDMIYLNIGRGKNDYFQLHLHQPWVYDPQLFLDYLMKLNTRMGAGDWYQSWLEIHGPQTQQNPRKIKKMVKAKKHKPSKIIKIFHRDPQDVRRDYTIDELLELKKKYYDERGQHVMYPEFSHGCKECGSHWKHRYFCSKLPPGTEPTPYRRNPLSLEQIDTFNPQQPYLIDGICFDPIDGSGSVGNSANINYMGFVAFLKTNDFLSFCHTLEYPRETLNFYQKTVAAGEVCICPPMLYIAEDKSTNRWYVHGHEGRHRATLLKILGFEYIPVYVFPAYLRARDIDDQFLSSIERIQDEAKISYRKFDPQALIIDSKVYAGNSDWGLWQKPISVATTKIVEPVPGFPDSNYYYSRPSD